MTQRTLLVSIPFVAALACTGVQSPPPAPEAPVVDALSTDPTVVGPTVYVSRFENDSVRINHVSFDPAEEIAMHSHPDHVAYVISGGRLAITGPDGATQELDLAAGQAVFLPAASHAAKNVGDTVVELAQVELKVPAGNAAPEGGDPAVVGPTIYKMVYENERARVFETTFAKGAEIGMHAHPDHAAWVLSGGKLQITNAAGTTTDIDLAPGDAVFLPAEAHSAKNLGESEIKLVVFEIKPAAPAVATP